MLLDKFSKAPKFLSQMTKVYNLSGQYLWLLYLVSFLMLKEISKENISMHLSVVRPGCVHGWWNGGGAVSKATTETQLMLQHSPR